MRNKAKGQERGGEATDLRVWKKEIDERTEEDRGKETRAWKRKQTEEN